MASNSLWTDVDRQTDKVPHAWQKCHWVVYHFDSLLYTLQLGTVQCSYKSAMLALSAIQYIHIYTTLINNSANLFATDLDMKSVTTIAQQTYSTLYIHRTWFKVQGKKLVILVVVPYEYIYKTTLCMYMETTLVHVHIAKILNTVCGWLLRFIPMQSNITRLVSCSKMSK